jgi:nitrite reductase/ring-hydroxylating ferredoxin subunit
MLVADGLLALCATDDVGDGEARKVETPQGDFAVFNLGGEFFVMENACTHGPGNLGEGFVEGEEIECDFHQGRFAIRTGQPTAPPCTDPVRIWDVVLRDGQVCIDPDAGHYSV